MSRVAGCHGRFLTQVGVKKYTIVQTPETTTNLNLNLTWNYELRNV